MFDLAAGLQTMLRRSGHQPRRKNIGRQVFRVRSQVECERFYAAIPLWCLLRLLEIKGTRMPKYCVDLRMCGSKTSRKN